MSKKIFIILTIGCVILWSQFAYSQLMHRSMRSYTNYGWEDFKNYPENQPVFPRYDYLGNYLLEGFNVYTWEEYRTISPNEGSLIIKGRMFREWMRQLIIANDTFGNWSTRFAMGEAIRTTFTPLTLDLTRFSGIRFDLASNKQNFTVIHARVSDPITLDPSRIGIEDYVEKRHDGVFLLGGNWQGKFLREHLTLGASLVNMYRFDSQMKLKDNSYQGVAIRDAIPDTIVVRFTDDSPEDGKGGAAIYYIYAMAQVKYDDKVTSVRLNPSQVSKSPGVITNYNYLEASGEYNVGIARVPVSVTYSFPMPPNTIDVDFVAMLANDYRISIRQSHHYEFEKGITLRTITVTDEEKVDEPNFPFFITRRAEANVRDMSNKGIVRFSYGMTTAMTTVGFNMEFNIVGFKLKGEYAQNFSNFQYPVRCGGREQWRDNAYFLTLTKDLKPFTFGGEIFSIGPKYNSYATKGPFWYFNETREIPIEMGNAEGYNNVYAFVDDNDDNDIWPDDWARDYGPFTPTNFRTMNQSGIFPGLDKDQDQWPDYNVNDNGIPDWDEPFLQYFADPIEFQYGEDNNNNFIIDVYEDDLLPQYPYYKDESGKHFFAALSPVNDVKFTFGSVNISQIAGGGTNKMTYGKINIDHQLQLWKGNIWYEHQVKFVKDDICNDWYEFTLQERTGTSGLPYYMHTKFTDYLLMKNSLVHRGYLEIKFNPVHNLKIINKVKYEFNYQRAAEFSDGSSQPEDRIDFIGMVSKVEYKYKYRGFTIMPRIKNLWFRWARKSYDQPYENKDVLMPILRVDYRLTPKTSIKLGIQGFPLLENKLWNWGNPDYSYTERNFILLVSNNTYFQGYKVIWEIGWQYNNCNYDGPALRDDDFSKAFVRIHCGTGTLR